MSGIFMSKLSTFGPRSGGRTALFGGLKVWIVIRGSETCGIRVGISKGFMKPLAPLIKSKIIESISFLPFFLCLRFTMDKSSFRFFRDFMRIRFALRKSFRFLGDL